MNPQQNDHATLLGMAVLLAIALGAAAWKKVGPTLLHTWDGYSWWITVIAIVTGLVAVGLVFASIWNKVAESTTDHRVTEADETSIPLGTDENGKPVHLKQQYRSSHAQVIGTTNAGKTESIILPWAIRDIENGSGLLIVDGKGDKSFLDKLYAYVVKHNRQDDFRLFSLAHISPSYTFNPLMGGTAAEVAQRVFSSFPIEHPHYRATQGIMFQALLTLVQDLEAVPTFQLLHALLSDHTTLSVWLKDYEKINRSNHSYLNTFYSLSRAERMQEVSGLDANLMHFVTGESASLFNTKTPQIDFDKVLSENQICYFQLPTMYCPFLAEATGKLVLQCFQHAVAKRQLHGNGKPEFFSCFLDDFQDYIYPGFGALLNKARSANIGVVFSHQALGDLDKVGPEFRNVVTTCTNIKVVMRNNDPDTCDFYAKTFGTETVEKTTERQKKEFVFTTKTGDGSVREVEKYLVHPNTIRQLQRGQGVISIPHPGGVKLQTTRFQMRPNLVAVPLPHVNKDEPAEEKSSTAQK